MSKDLGVVTAYGYALSKGYQGTEEEFAQQQAQLAEAAAQIEENTASIDGLKRSAGLFVQDVPWVKELYLFDPARFEQSGCILSSVNIYDDGGVRLYLASTAEDKYVGDTGKITKDQYDIVPIITRTSPAETIGYIIVDWPGETRKIKKPVLEKSFNLDYSPAIKEYLNNIAASASSNAYIAPSDFTVACIGDSLTCGYLTTEETTAKGYPYWFGKALGCNVKNYGYGGASCRSWYEGKRGFLDSAIDAAVIMLGTNGGVGVNQADDTSFLPQAPYLPNTMTAWRTTYPTYDDYPDGEHCQAAYLCRIIEYIYEHCGSDTKIILCIPPYNDYSNSYGKTVINSETTIRQIAAMYRLPVIDILNEFGPNFLTTRSIHSGDYLHFTEDGYRQLGSFIGNRFRSLIGLPLKRI